MIFENFNATGFSRHFGAPIVTKLHEAVRNKNHILIQRILSSKNILEKTKINTRDENGCIPLHLTASYVKDTKTNRSIIQTLLEKGSNLDAQNKNGYIPLQEAILNGNTVLFNCLKDLEHTKAYMKNSRKAFQVFLNIVGVENLELLKWAVSQKPDLINQKDKDNTNAIHYAVWYNCFESFVWLLDRVTIKTINQTDMDNRTPLHMAIRYERSRMFSMLWDRLYKFDAITSEAWLELFKYTIVKYIPVKNITDHHIGKTTKLKRKHYGVVQPVFFEALLTRIPKKVGYGTLLNVATDSMKDHLERHADTARDLQLDLGTYIIKKMTMSIALIVAHANNFGLLDAQRFTVNPRIFSNFPVSERLENVMQKELYRILYPHYVTRCAQIRWQIEPNPTLAKSEYKKDLMVNEMLAWVWPRWNIHNKLRTIYTWLFLVIKKDNVSQIEINSYSSSKRKSIKTSISKELPKSLFKKLPYEITTQILWEICRDSLQKTVSSNLPLFSYGNILNESQITYAIFIKFLKHFGAFYENLRDFTQQKEKNKDLSEKELDRALYGKFSIFFETTRSLKHTVRLASQLQTDKFFEATENTDFSDSESTSDDYSSTSSLER